MEDSPDMNMFNYCKKRLSKAPTDYYLRPFFKAIIAESIIDSDVRQHFYLNDPDLKLTIFKCLNKYYNCRLYLGLFWLSLRFCKSHKSKELKIFCI